MGPAIARKTSAFWPTIAATVWTVLALIGAGVGFAYDAAPGDSGKPVLRTAPAHLPRLIVFLHPQCPCSRATVFELKRLLQDQSLATEAYVFRPAPAPSDWRDSDFAAELRRIPNLVVNSDPNGTVAQRFGVRTSGHVLLFGPDGTRLFSGGLTTMRGMEGQSAAGAEIRRYLLDRTLPRTEAPIFGCAIR